MRTAWTAAVLAITSACIPAGKPAGPDTSAVADLTVGDCKVAVAGGPAPPAPPGEPASTSAPAAPPGEVRAGELTATGKLGLDAIRGVVSGLGPRFERCYRDALRTTPGLEGRLTAAFTIAGDGGVASVRINGGFHPGVTACVEEAIRGLVFPAPASGTVEVNYPLVFRLPAEDAAPAPAAEAPAAAPAPSVGDAQSYVTSVVQPGLTLNREALASCFSERPAPGIVVFELSLAVAASAEIGDVSVERLRDPPVEQCITGIVRGMVLARPPGPIVARCQVRSQRQ